MFLFWDLESELGRPELKYPMKGMIYNEREIKIMNLSRFLNRFHFFNPGTSVYFLHCTINDSSLNRPHGSRAKNVRLDPLVSESESHGVGGEEHRMIMIVLKKREKLQSVPWIPCSDSAHDAMAFGSRGASFTMAS